MLRLLACIGVLVTVALPAWPWSRGGHMTVAYIAYQKLTPAAKAKVDALLTKNPAYDKWVMDIPDTPANHVLRTLTAFLRASLWPDDIKGEAGYRDAGAVINGQMNINRPPNTPEAGQNIGYADKLRHRYWHFHDTPFSSDHTPTQSPETPSALTQIPKMRDALAMSADEDLQSYDLVWLIHLVGDVHQPLHSAQRFTAMQPEGDAGGNAVKLCATSPSCSRNLHSLWDGLFGTDLDPDAAIAFGQDLLLGTPTPPAKASISDPAIWIQQSFQLAKTRAYAAPIKKDGSPSPTNAAYRKKAREAGEKQLVLGGIGWRT